MMLMAIVALSLTSLGLGFMLCAVSYAYHLMELRAKAAELALQEHRCVEVTTTTTNQQAIDAFLAGMSSTKPNGWYGMHES